MHDLDDCEPRHATVVEFPRSWNWDTFATQHSRYSGKAGQMQLKMVVVVAAVLNWLVTDGAWYLQSIRETLSPATVFATSSVAPLGSQSPIKGARTVTTSTKRSGNWTPN